MADPATFLSSNSVLGSYFPLRTACLFICGKNIHISEFVLLGFVLLGSLYKVNIEMCQFLLNQKSCLV